MNRKHTTITTPCISLTLAAMTLIAATSFAGTIPGFQGLGDLPGDSFRSVAFGVSADGLVVVGISDSGNGTTGGEAFLWTSEGGMVGLGDLAGSRFESSAYGVSYDGIVVVGEALSDSGIEAFLWTSGGGMVGLGDLTGGVFQSFAKGVSADGSVVVGRGISAQGIEAFRWTSGGGMIGLGDLPGGIFESIANGVSADGSVVVGISTSSLGIEAFRWTSEGGMVGLGDLPGSVFKSRALGVSGDGSVVVGSGNITFDGGNDSGEVFRWTSKGGMVGLGDLSNDGFVGSRAFGVSGDGSVVVGWSDSAIFPRREAFIWDAANGMQSLYTVLKDQLGLNMTGWELDTATGISADGRVVVGGGKNPEGNFEGWIAVLSVAPVCRADINADGFVNVNDLLNLLAGWGACPAPECAADLNSNGFVNVTDLLELLALWGACP